MRKNFLKFVAAITIIGLVSIATVTKLIGASAYYTPTLTPPNVSSYFVNTYTPTNYMPTTMAAALSTNLANHATIKMACPKTYNMGVWYKFAVTGATNNNYVQMKFLLSYDGITWPNDYSYSTVLSNTQTGVSGSTSDTVLFASIPASNFAGAQYFKLGLLTNGVGVVITNKSLTLGYYP